MKNEKQEKISEDGQKEKTTQVQYLGNKAWRKTHSEKWRHDTPPSSPLSLPHSLILLLFSAEICGVCAEAYQANQASSNRREMALVSSIFPKVAINVAQRHYKGLRWQFRFSSSKMLSY
jgi:hypothetical protein